MEVMSETTGVASPKYPKDLGCQNCMEINGANNARPYLGAAGTWPASSSLAGSDTAARWHGTGAPAIVPAPAGCVGTHAGAPRRQNHRKSGRIISHI